MNVFRVSRFVVASMTTLGSRVTVVGSATPAVGTYAFPAGGKPLTVFQNPG